MLKVLKKKDHPKEKLRLHHRNKHRERYDFKLLIANCPELEPFVVQNVYKDETVDFFNPEAVKFLNKALLKSYYGVNHWDVPEGYLCPPIPGRADYIHYIADLLARSNNDKIPKGSQVQCLDVGVGANCVYPIIGNYEYGWSFIGAEIDSEAIESARRIIESNTSLRNAVEIRNQPNSNDIFKGIFKSGEIIDVTICNPPFHASASEAQLGSKRKLSNLKKQNVNIPVLNFGGKHNELCCDGGEVKFVQTMIKQSKDYASSCCWFTSLISKQSHLKNIYETLHETGVSEVKTIAMGQGNKSSRIVSWTFLSPDQLNSWGVKRWQ